MLKSDGRNTSAKVNKSGRLRDSGKLFVIVGMILA